jgi:hypothetical protein
MAPPRGGERGGSRPWQSAIGGERGGRFSSWFAAPPGMRDGGGRLHFAAGAAAPAGV